MKKYAAVFAENVAEAGSACLVTMLQGNLLAMTMSHWLIASQTGLVAGAATTAALAATRTDNRWLIAGMLGVLTAVVDFFIHPAMLASAILESVLTGAGAAALSWLVSTLIRRRRADAT